MLWISIRKKTLTFVAFHIPNIISWCILPVAESTFYISTTCIIKTMAKLRAMSSKVACLTTSIKLTKKKEFIILTRDFNIKNGMVCN